MKSSYIVPEIEIIEVEVEKGFAGSQLETPGVGGNHGWGKAFGDDE